MRFNIDQNYWIVNKKFAILEVYIDEIRRNINSDNQCLFLFKDIYMFDGNILFIDYSEKNTDGYQVFDTYEKAIDYVISELSKIKCLLVDRG